MNTPKAIIDVEIPRTAAIPQLIAGFQMPNISASSILPRQQRKKIEEIDTPDKAAKQLTDLQQKFRSAKERSDRRIDAITDSEYWFAVCFQSREQKEAFLKAVNWISLGDKYLDGTAIALSLKISLPPAADLVFIKTKSD